MTCERRTRIPGQDVDPSTPESRARVFRLVSRCVTGSKQNSPLMPLECVCVTACVQVFACCVFVCVSHRLSSLSSRPPILTTIFTCLANKQHFFLSSSSSSRISSCGSSPPASTAGDQMENQRSGQQIHQTKHTHNTDSRRWTRRGQEERRELHRLCIQADKQLDSRRQRKNAKQRMRRTTQSCCSHSRE